MDGSDVRAIVTQNVTWNNGIAVDVATERIFWNDAKTDRIETADLNGQNRFEVASFFTMHPFSMSVFGDYVYWSDWTFQNIQACNKFSGKDHHIVIQV